MGEEASDWKRRTRRLRGGRPRVSRRARAPKAPRQAQKPKSAAKQAKQKQRATNKAARAKKGREEGLKRKAEADKQKAEGTFQRKSKKEKREEKKATRKKKKDNAAATRKKKEVNAAAKKKQKQDKKQQTRAGPVSASLGGLGSMIGNAMGALTNVLAAIGAAIGAILGALGALFAGIAAALAGAIGILSKLIDLFSSGGLPEVAAETNTPEKRDAKCDGFVKDVIGICRKTRLEQVINVCAESGYTEKCVSAFDQIYHQCTRPAEEVRVVCKKSLEMAAKNPAGAKAYVQGEMTRIQNVYGKQNQAVEAALKKQGVAVPAA